MILPEKNQLHFWETRRVTTDQEARSILIYTVLYGSKRREGTRCLGPYQAYSTRTGEKARGTTYSMLLYRPHRSGGECAQNTYKCSTWYIVARIRPLMACVWLYTSFGSPCLLKSTFRRHSGNRNILFGLTLLVVRSAKLHKDGAQGAEPTP